jgi:hypothetical protein
MTNWSLSWDPSIFPDAQFPSCQMRRKSWGGRNILGPEVQMETEIHNTTTITTITTHTTREREKDGKRRTAGQLGGIPAA